MLLKAVELSFFTWNIYNIFGMVADVSSDAEILWFHLLSILVMNI